MPESGAGSERSERSASASAMLLLQAAAARAGIGPFAQQGLATPQAAAGSYRMVAGLVAKAARP